MKDIKNIIGCGGYRINIGGVRLMLKYAVISTSDITRQFIEGAATTGLWELTAIYSRTIESGKAFGKPYGVDTVFTDIEALAKREEIDMVYVASPNYLHYEHSKILLQNGKHVICEKPLTTYLWQAQELYQIAEENDVVLMEAITFMHHPNRRVIQDAIPLVGSVTAAFFDNSQRSSKYDAYLGGALPNIFNPELHAGGLMDMGVYSLYPALCFFGRPEMWQAQAVMMERGADALGSILMKYEDKVVNVRYSKISHGGAGADIQGAEGVLRIDYILHMGDVYFINNQGEKTLLAKRLPKIQVMAAEAEHFHQFITERKVREECMDFYKECKHMSLLVCEYLEKCREEIGLPF